MARILVIDDERGMRLTFKSFLAEAGYEVATAENYTDAAALISARDFDLIFADIILEGRTGIDILKMVRDRGLLCPVIMITGAPDIKTATDALRLGAFDYIPKPIQHETLLRITEMALRHRAILEEKERYRSNLEAIFKSVRDAIITVDKELKVIEVNEAGGDICGFSREIIGKDFDSVTDGCDKKCLEALRLTLEKKEPVKLYRIECHPRHRMNTVVNLTAYPMLNGNGVFSGGILLIRDETQMAALEQDLEEFYQFHNIVGRSEKMRRIYSLIDDLADVDTAVLITGESGTGKELVAEALHYMGERGTKPLIKVNCSALSEEILESELFGHVKGAFTGAIRDKVGRFQLSDGGTIFLDEIGDISPKVQLKLLRVLQEKEFERVGDSSPVKVDVRVISATNRDIKEKIKSGEFREDLYYRLKVVEINLPPLRERREDIPILFDFFIKNLNKKFNKEIIGISDEAMNIFMSYPWHGNVRELGSALEHAFILCKQNIITVDHLPLEFKEFVKNRGQLIKEEIGKEGKLILDALDRSSGNKARAARLLGMSRQTFYRKLKGLKDNHKLEIPEV